MAVHSYVLKVQKHEIGVLCKLEKLTWLSGVNICDVCFWFCFLDLAEEALIYLAVIEGIAETRVSFRSG